MDWIKASLYTTKAGIEPVLGMLLNFGIDSTQVSDGEEFDAFLEEKQSQLCPFSAILMLRCLVKKT